MTLFQLKMRVLEKSSYGEGSWQCLLMLYSSQWRWTQGSQLKPELWVLKTAILSSRKLWNTLLIQHKAWTPFLQKWEKPRVTNERVYKDCIHKPFAIQVTIDVSILWCPLQLSCIYKASDSLSVSTSEANLHDCQYCILHPLQWAHGWRSILLLSRDIVKYPWTKASIAIEYLRGQAG